MVEEQVVEDVEAPVVEEQAAVLVGLVGPVARHVGPLPALRPVAPLPRVVRALGPGHLVKWWNGVMVKW